MNSNRNIFIRAQCCCLHLFTNSDYLQSLGSSTRLFKGAGLNCKGKVNKGMFGISTKAEMVITFT